MFRCGNILLLATRFFDVAKFTILTPLSLLLWCKLSFPIVGLKLSSLPNFALKSLEQSFIFYVGKSSKTCYNSSQKLSFASSLLSSLDACTFKKILDLWPLRFIYNILSLTNSTLLTADTILMMIIMIMVILMYCNWVSTRWQWWVVLYKNRKETAQKEKNIQRNTKTIKNTEYTKLDNKNKILKETQKEY